MAADLNIDFGLLEEACRLGKFKTRHEAVNAALKEYIQRKKQKSILDFFNTVDFDSSYDYKNSRKQF
jgi:hypothetical protein